MKTFRLLLIFSMACHLAASAALAAFDSAQFNQADHPLQITGIQPSGEDVPASRQIVFHFNRPVVPVGRMERSAGEIPVTIEPPTACEWRWLNTSALACQLTEENALQPATRYRIRVEPGIAAEDGSTLAEAVEHTFLTLRPKIDSTYFKTWEAPGIPVIRIWFQLEVTRESTAAHLFFQTPDGRRVAARVEEDPDYRDSSYYQPGRIWLVRPETELPLDSTIELRVEPGLVPIKGEEPGAEDRVAVQFDTFPEFAFSGVRCWNNEDREVVIRPGDMVTSGQFCNPLNRVELLFSAPVLASELKGHLTVIPDLAGGRTDYDPWAGYYDYSRLSRPHSRGKDYRLPLPEVLQAYQPYTLMAAEGTIRDEFGRALPAAIRQLFSTDHRKPDFNFERHFSVLEKGEQTELPIVVTNLDRIRLSYDTLTVAGRVSGRQHSLSVDKAEDVSFRMPLEVRKMLSADSGVVSGQFDTEPSVPGKGTYSRWFFAQVTPFAVETKLGHFNSLVWVTDLATGQPAAGVEVEVYQEVLPGLNAAPTVLAGAVTDANGLAMLPGTDNLDPDLKLYRGDRTKPKLFVRCRRGDELALMPLVDDFEARYRDEAGSYVYNEMEPLYGHIRTWGTTAQGVYRAGDTVQYKVWVRNQDSRRFVPPPLEGYTLEVIDPMGKSVYQIKDLTLNEFGACSGEFTVPKNGAVGWYRFVLKAGFHDGQWQPMRVLVSDFTPAPFKVLTDLNGELFRAGEEVAVDTRARLHAGGPYAEAQARITARLQARSFVPDHPVAREFAFDTGSATRRLQTVFSVDAAVDGRGDLQTRFTLAESDVLYGRLRVESAVRDDRGKYIASEARAAYVGRDRYVGLRQTDWTLEQGQPATVDVLVTDEVGRPAARTEVVLQVSYRETTAARVKGAGNAYLTRFEHKWVAVSEERLTSAKSPTSRAFTPDRPGLYSITARINDSLGRPHATTVERWATGKGAVVWATEEGYGLKLTPEKTEYSVGETARFLVQNPFPGAQALITVERYGVLKSWVTTLADSTAVVEVEVEPDFLPGFYLSVSLMSPRVDKPLGDGQVDLGKPTFRMGYLRVPVRDPAKELVVTARTARDLYRPRETVTLDLQAAPRGVVDGQPLPPMELAVAVLDESVLDLIQGGTGYYDVYRGFYRLDDLDVANYNLLMQLIGRQKFEKKGASQGGDGGPDLALRTLFKFVSYWNPAIKTDATGRARVSFELPDNLTGWRVLVMAVTPEDRMGLGETSFRVNRPTELRPVLPNQVSEGDSFEAGFSVMNRTPDSRTLTVALGAEGPLTGESPRVTRQVTVAPYKRSTVWLPLVTLGPGELTLTAKAWDDLDGDALRRSLPVRPAVSLETAATYGTTTAPEVSESIAFPEAIRSDAGEVSVVAAPTVIGNLEGAFAYLRDYPYICWEQKLSKGVMASHYLELKEYLAADLEWPEAAAVIETTLKQAGEHQAPNGGMVYYVPRDEYVSPYLSAYTAVAFNWLRGAGHAVPELVERRLHDYLLGLLRKEVLPGFYSKGMASTVRAVALAALAPHGKIGPADLERYRSHLAEMSLFGKAHFLLASLAVDGTSELRRETARAILSHANETGGKFIFSEELDSGFRRLLASTLRTQGAILSALLAYGETADGAAEVADVPFKLVRTITQGRGQRDRWGNTQENLFCLNALIEYSRAYERETPDMRVTARLDGRNFGQVAFRARTDPAVTFARPVAEGDPGRKATVILERVGTGRLYYAARLSFAPLASGEKPINSGLEVHREYSVERDGRWRLLESPMELKTGELVRVDLYLSLPAARNFVVVDDPVPGGLEPVNRDLATASAVDADKAEFQAAEGSFWFSRGDWRAYAFSRWSFYHRELRHHAARFYSEYLPAGNYHLSYTAQAIAAGAFQVLPARAEEMYDPDVFGKGTAARLVVERAE